MTKEEYFQQKSKYYYDMYLQNKYVRKVSTILKVKDKFLVLVKDNCQACLAGGSVESDETTRDGAIRETFEEMGIKTNNLKYLTKVYYSVKWTYNNLEFDNKRIEFYYLCELESTSGKVQGLDGEFDNNVELKLCSIAELEKLNLNKKELEIIKEIK
jgi:8-oxo-dGTP pyrophosphatase MutT (NUDIX family)